MAATLDELGRNRNVDILRSVRIHDGGESRQLKRLPNFGITSKAVTDDDRLCY